MIYHIFILAITKLSFTLSLCKKSNIDSQFIMSSTKSNPINMSYNNHDKPMNLGNTIHHHHHHHHHHNDKLNLFQKLSFSWVTNLVRTSHSRSIQICDLIHPTDLLSQNRNTSILFRQYFDEEYQRYIDKNTLTTSSTTSSSSSSTKNVNTTNNINDTNINTSQLSSKSIQSSYSHNKESNSKIKIKKKKSSFQPLIKVYYYSPIIRAFFRIYYKDFFFHALLKLCKTVLQMIPSLLIAKILSLVENIEACSTNPSHQYITIFYSILLFLVLSIRTIIENQFFHYAISLSAMIRCIITETIYKKSLQLAMSSRQNNTVGEIVNFMQLDCTRIREVFGTGHALWDSLLQLAGYTVLLLHFLGPSVLVGIAVMVCIFPLNAIFLKKLSKYKATSFKLTDSRVKLTNEVLQGIRAIKSYNWEKPFAIMLSTIRKQELIALKKSANIRAIISAILIATPSFVAVITLAVYTLLGNILTPTKVFSALALFNQLRFPLQQCPNLINTMIDGQLSLDRLTKFLISAEIEGYVENSDSVTVKNSDNVTLSEKDKMESQKLTEVSNRLNLDPNILSQNNKIDSHFIIPNDMNNIQHIETYKLTHSLSSDELLSHVSDDSIFNMINIESRDNLQTWRTVNSKDIITTTEYTTHINNKINKTSIDYAISINNVSFYWIPMIVPVMNQTTMKIQSTPISNGDKRGNLNHVDIHIKKGELVAIVGPVGSGKSNLLSAILGDMNKVTGTSGRVIVNGNVAYVPQTSWIPNDTLRNVILFGRAYEENKYKQAIKVCNLEKDLELLDSGDMTEIGEKGANLSGGQKQRLSMARAVYEDADVYLFDDPLSALDAEVSNRVFSACIYKHLRHKTRILVTHQLSVLPYVDRVIIMHQNEYGEGYIKDQGSLQELMSRGYDISALVRKDIDKELNEDEKEIIMLSSRREYSARNMTNETISNTVPDIDIDIDIQLNTNVTSSISQKNTNVNMSLTNSSLQILTIPPNNLTTPPPLPVYTIHSEESSRKDDYSTAEYMKRIDSVRSITSDEFINILTDRHNMSYTSTITTTATNVSLSPISPRAGGNNNNSSSSSIQTSPSKSLNDITIKKQTTIPDSTISILSPNINMKKSDTRNTLEINELKPLLVEESVEKLHKIKSDTLLTSTPHTNINNITNTTTTTTTTTTTSTNTTNTYIPTSTHSSKKFMSAEVKKEGAISYTIYSKYIIASKQPLLLIFILITFLCTNLCQLVHQQILSIWTSDMYYRQFNLSLYLSAVLLTSSGIAFFTWIRSYMGILFGIGSSNTLHHELILKCLSAPLSYFESTPLGRLIQCFSKDIDHIDQDLPSSLLSSLTSVLTIITSLSTIAMATPKFLILMFPILMIYYNIVIIYFQSSRDIKRIDSITRTPIYQLFGETFSGIQVIRSYKKQNLYMNTFLTKLHVNFAAFYSSKLIDRWLCVRTELLGDFIVFCSALLIIISSAQGSKAGVSLSTALTLSNILNRTMRNLAESELYMTSVERVLGVTENIIEENINLSPNSEKVKQELSTNSTNNWNTLLNDVNDHHSTSINNNNNNNNNSGSKMPIDDTSSYKKESSHKMDYIDNINILDNTVDSMNDTWADTVTETTALIDSSHNKDQTTTSNTNKNKSNIVSKLLLKPIDFKDHSNVIYNKHSTWNQVALTTDDDETNNVTPYNIDHEIHRVEMSDDELIKSGWPWQGGIVFNDVVMRYRSDFDPVLKGVSVSIHPGESIGIVGRTGSGKSTLFRVLLRLNEVEEGSVYIDGVDISKVGLDTLRSRISIIPQDAVLFSGSIRMNLDPFHQYTDEELWTALRKAHALGMIANLPGGLNFEVSEGGENFSAGQRQQLCLARALVRRSKILILDEATSSVDYETDALIQSTIREEFGHGKCTVLTIAHRLGSILDSDRILVMSKGQVGELDTPDSLLQNKESLFYQLIKNEGKLLS